MASLPVLAMIDTALWAGLREPLALLGDPSARAYAPFLLASLGIAVAVAAWRTRSLARAARQVVAPRVWLHRSARMDVRLLMIKAVVHTLLFAPLLVSAYTVAVVVVDGLTGALGPAAPSALSDREITVLYTVVLFVAWDASRYLVHRLLHAVPALWEIHQVHHSAEVLTPLTVYRVHPIESLLFALRGALMTGLVTGVFFYAFRDRALQAEILGVNAIGFVLNAVGANLRHSHIWLSYGRRVERFLISPAQHQIHHSVDAAGHRTNYGAFLAVWDRLAGTWRAADRASRPRRFGLPGALRNHHPARALSAVIGPIRVLVSRAWRRVAGRPISTPVPEQSYAATRG
jgi:sterol desaturase/sphingolipid hydroxylase (fatty acid hydroxylase superfamily)